jgi:hypothetical protein
LVIVTVLAALGTLICSLPKLIVAGDRPIDGGFSPVPLSLTDCARNASEITRVPVSPAATLGENVTDTPQELPAANWLPQLLTALKSVLPAELETDVPMLVNGKPPLFRIVTVIGADVAPSTVGLKLRLVVDSVSVGPTTAVPLKEAVCVPALSATTRLPLAGPASEGLKSTVTVHAASAAKDAPHVFVTTAKGPLTATDEIETELPPTF